MAVGILLSIAILIISAKVFGEIAERLKIAPLAGEVFGGIVAGSLHLVSPDATLQEIANLGILFLLFAIGLGMKEKSELTGGIALGGAALSFALGFLLSFYLFSNLLVALVVGAALLSTSAVATMKSLMDFGEYGTKIYKILSSMEIVDSFLAILAISLLSVSFSNPVLANFAAVFLLLAFLLFAFTIGPRVANSFLSLFRFMKDEQIFIAVPLVVVFLAAFVSEQLGMIGLAGAFLAGLAMSKSPFTEGTIMPKIKTIGYGFFVPLFFAYSGLLFDAAAILNNYWLIGLLVAAGLLGKLLGCGFLAGFFGLKWHERKIIGFSMFPRGEYSIIIIQLALAAAVITAAVYTALISFVLVSIILTPLLLRAFAKA